MEQERLGRINELANKEKREGLSKEEKDEQKLLREEYLKDFRASLRGILDNTYVQYPDGKKEKLQNKNDK